LPVSGISYKIKKGDTLSAIAKKYKVSVKEVKEFNDLSDKGLKIGQKIILPGAEKKPEVSLVKPSSKRKSSYISEPSKISLVGDGNVSKYLNWRGIVPYGKGAKISVPKRKNGRYRYTKTNYGYFTHPAPGTVRTQGIHHRNAIDMGGPRGTNIYAAADGKVIKSYSGG
jgi:murein DD-endopeptidase MepM/ murein hydrolase activator NlpD